MRPPEIEKGADSYTDAPDSPLSQKTAYPRVYRCAGRPARLRLVHDDGLRARVLEKAACEVRECPQTLSLWAFRLSQHVNAGTYGFAEVWETLEAAALDAGVRETRIARVLYSSFADSMRSPAPPMPLTVLKGGVH
jgi:hypothetical protein